MRILPVTAHHIFSRLVLATAFSLLLLPSAFTNYSHPTQAGGQMITPAPPDSTTDIFFLDAMHGWALVGAPGQRFIAVIRTEDGGMSWKKIGEEPGLDRIFFLDQMQGWAFRYIPGPNHDSLPDCICLMGTTDGGKRWTELGSISKPRASNIDLPLDFLFIDQSHGWVVGQGQAGGGIFLKTMNGGRSFSSVKSAFKGDETLLRILSDPKGHILILGDQTILVSLDRGKTWQLQMPTEWTDEDYVEGYLYGGWLFPEGHWLATGGGSSLAEGNFSTTGKIFLTTDYGAHWKVVENSLGKESIGSHAITDVSFYDDKHGCASLDSFLVVCTSDAGQTWTTRTVPRKTTSTASFDGDSFKRIILLPNGLGWLISDMGFIYQTKDYGQTWDDFDLLKVAS